MCIYVTVDAFIFFDTEPFDLWERWTIPSLATNLAPHWEFLAALLNTDKKGRSLGAVIATFMQLLQSVHVCARLCCAFSSVLILLTELRRYLDRLVASWGTGQEGRLAHGKKKHPWVKCQPIFLPCLLRLMGKANALQSSEIWLKSVRIFHSLWAGHHFLGGSCFVGFWFSVLHLQQGLCAIAFHENKVVVMSNCSSEWGVALTLVRLWLKLAKVIKFEEYSERSLGAFRAHMGDLLSFGSVIWNADRN